jgi:hypothetical protein
MDIETKIQDKLYKEMNTKYKKQSLKWKKLINENKLKLYRITMQNKNKGNQSLLS